VPRAATPFIFKIFVIDHEILELKKTSLKLIIETLMRSTKHPSFPKFWIDLATGTSSQKNKPGTSIVACSLTNQPLPHISFFRMIGCQDFTWYFTSDDSSIADEINTDLIEYKNTINHRIVISCNKTACSWDTSPKHNIYRSVHYKRLATRSHLGRKKIIAIHHFHDVTSFCWHCPHDVCQAGGQCALFPMHLQLKFTLQPYRFC
jgi:hypothetical protein